MKNLKKIFIITALVITLFSTKSFSATVKSIAYGSWTIDYTDIGGHSYAVTKGLWLDVKVENLGYEKVVGMRWTDDNWETYTDSFLTYDKSIDNNFEIWGLRFDPFFYATSYYIGSWTNYINGNSASGPAPASEIEFAIFYKVNGQEYWDNNDGQNYKIDVLEDI